MLCYPEQCAVLLEVVVVGNFKKLQQATHSVHFAGVTGLFLVIVNQIPHSLIFVTGDSDPRQSV